jgi:peptidoglycan/LPS O-acetylase OafA/YrhL
MNLRQHRGGRYQSLDLWRGVACLSVIVFHVTGYRPEGSRSWIWLLTERMWLGVPLFFVISGYCITASADRTRLEGRPMVEFFRRRLRRIFPPFWAAFGFTVLMVGMLFALGQGSLLADRDGLRGFLPLDHIATWQWLGTFSLTEGWRPHFIGSSPVYWFAGHFWTLGQEEQFYAVAGALVLVDRRRWFTSAALLTIGVAWLDSRVQQSLIEGFFFDGRWFLFAAGIAVYYHVRYGTGLRALLVPTVLFSAMLWSLFRLDWSEPHLTFPLELACASSFALLLIALYRWDEAFVTSPALRPLAWCGFRCYSVYLMGAPVTHVVGSVLQRAGVDGITGRLLIVLPLALVCSLLIAGIFHAQVERRFLNPRSDGRPIAANRGLDRLRRDAAVVR